MLVPGTPNWPPNVPSSDCMFTACGDCCPNCDGLPSETCPVRSWTVSVGWPGSPSIPGVTVSAGEALGRRIPKGRLTLVAGQACG